MRLKKNISPIGSSLETIKSIRGVEFEWKGIPGSKSVGFIAQEVLPHVPELVHWDEKKALYSMKYREMIAVSVEALKEQDIKITELESRYERLVQRAKEKGLT